MKKILDHQAKGMDEAELHHAAPSETERGMLGEASRAVPQRDEPREPAADPFDPAFLALGQNFAEAMGVKKLATHVPVRKPYKHEWIGCIPTRRIGCRPRSTAHPG